MNWWAAMSASMESHCVGTLGLEEEPEKKPVKVTATVTITYTTEVEVPPHLVQELGSIEAIVQHGKDYAEEDFAGILSQVARNNPSTEIVNKLPNTKKEVRAFLSLKQ